MSLVGKNGMHAIMFYTILSSVLLAFFFASGALGLWTVFTQNRRTYTQFWREYLPAFIYLAFAALSFVAAWFVGLQIPQCYVP